MPRTNSNKQATSGITFLIGAKPKTGKTFFGATASEHWPTEPGSASLSDLYWMEFDKGGTKGLIEYGVELPHMWDFVSPKDDALADELDSMRTDLVDKVGGGIKTVVVDTISAFAKRSEAYAHTITKGQDVWNIVAHQHAFLVNLLSRLPVNVVYLTHYKENFSDENAKKASADADVVADLSGRGANLYKQTAEVIGPLTKVALKNRPTTRTFWPHGRPGIEGGSRYKCLSASGEPANLGEIINKIKKEGLKQ